MSHLLFCEYVRAPCRKSLTDKLRQEDDKERCDQIIDSLDITAGGVTDSPDKEDTLKHLRKETKNILRIF